MTAYSTHKDTWHIVLHGGLASKQRLADTHMLTVRLPATGVGMRLEWSMLSGGGGMPGASHKFVVNSAVQRPNQAAGRALLAAILTSQAHRLVPAAYNWGHAWCAHSIDAHSALGSHLFWISPDRQPEELFVATF